MSVHRRGRLRLVVESVIAGAIGFAAVALVLVLLAPDPQGEVADVPDGSIGVDEVTALGSRRQDVVVSGFVFVGDERAVLCSGRDDGDPPFCDGTAIELRGLDTSRLDLVVPQDAPAYTRDEVTLAGSYALAALEVEEILQP